MNNRIYRAMLSSILAILLCSCGSSGSIVRVQNDAGDEYLKEKYGPSGVHQVYLLNAKSFSTITNMIRNAIIEDKNLNDNQKEAEVEKLNAMKFVENGYVCFWLCVLQPLYQKQYSLTFTLTDGTGSAIPAEVRFLQQKRLWAKSGRYGSSSGTNYDYVWLFRLDRKLDALGPGGLPAKLGVTYPNNRTNVYTIKP